MYAQADDVVTALFHLVLHQHASRQRGYHPFCVLKLHFVSTAGSTRNKLPSSTKFFAKMSCTSLRGAASWDKLSLSPSDSSDIGC